MSLLLVLFFYFQDSYGAGVCQVGAFRSAIDETETQASVHEGKSAGTEYVSREQGEIKTHYPSDENAPTTNKVTSISNENPGANPTHYKMETKFGPGGGDPKKLKRIPSGDTLEIKVATQAEHYARTHEEVSNELATAQKEVEGQFKYDREGYYRAWAKRRTEILDRVSRENVGTLTVKLERVSNDGVVYVLLPYGSGTKEYGYSLSAIDSFHWNGRLVSTTPVQ